MKIDAPDQAVGSPAPAGTSHTAEHARRLIAVPGALTPLSEGRARLYVRPVTELRRLDVLTATLRAFRQVETVDVEAVEGDTVHLLVALREPLSLAGQLRTRLGEAVVSARTEGDHLFVELDPSRSWLVEPLPGETPTPSAEDAPAHRRAVAPLVPEDRELPTARATETRRAVPPVQPPVGVPRASRGSASTVPVADGHPLRPAPSRPAPAVGRTTLPPRMAPPSVPAVDASGADALGRRDLSADVLARNVLDAIPDTSVLVLDPTLRFRAVAGTALARLGFPREELLGRPAREALPTLPWDVLEPACRSALHGDAAAREFESLDHAAVFEATVSPVRTGSDGPGAVLVLRDVTSRRRDAAVIADADEMFELSFAGAPIGKAIVAPDGRFLRVNRALCRLLGRTEDELQALHFGEITHPDDLDTDEALLQETLDGVREGYALEKRYRHADGHVVHAQLSVAVVRGEDGAPRWLVSQVVDVTRRHQLEAELRDGTERDGLTGLWNRSRLDAELAMRAQEAQRYGVGASLLSIDLDGFSAIDGTLGRQRSDAFLRTVATAIRSSIRDCDHCARTSADTFVVLLPHTPGAGAAIVAERIGEALKRCDAPGLAPGSLRASIGVAELVPGITAERWRRHADDARRVAERAGGGRAVLAESGPAAVPARTGENA